MHESRSEAYTLLHGDRRRLPSANFFTGRRRIDYPEGEAILRLSPISVSLITLEMYPTHFAFNLISIVGCICRGSFEGYVFRGIYLKNFSTNLSRNINFGSIEIDFFGRPKN